MRIFIDGQAGTTGLGIRARLSSDPRLTLVAIPEAHRKSQAARSDAYNAADLVILCLPDEAAREAVTLLHGLPDPPRVIDASTAHRTTPGWTYGFAEMDSGQAAAIAQALQVANPGCYATGIIALLRPLIANDLLLRDTPLTINAVSGYTGGGRAMVEQHERDGGPAFELYGLDAPHKHTPEILAYTGLAIAPVFVPSVAHLPQGMTVSIPLHADLLPDGVTPKRLREALATWYAGASAITVAAGQARIRPDALANTDAMALAVHEAGPHTVLTATLDNLGKGACGAAAQNARLMLGLD